MGPRLRWLVLSGLAIVLLSSPNLASLSSLVRTHDLAPNDVTAGSTGARPPAPTQGTAPLALAPKEYRIQFVEASLASGIGWSVTLTGGGISGTESNFSFSDSLNLSVPNGTYQFSVPPQGGYLVTPSSGNVTVAGAGVIEDVTFVPPAEQLQVEFSESGLPASSEFYVVFDGRVSSVLSPLTSLAIPCLNGTHAYAVGQDGQYLPTPAFGSLFVNGTSLFVRVQYDAPVTYALTFNEIGLAHGTDWTVYAQGVGGSTGETTGPTLTMNVTNGTYFIAIYADTATVGYVTSSSLTNVTVDGAPVLVNVSFVRAPYTLTIQESGLPANAFFAVWLHGLGATAEAGVGTVSFFVAKGNYSYWIEPVWTTLSGGFITGGYLAQNSTGNVTIRSSSVTIPVTFAPDRYALTFNVSGLGTPNNWTVILDNVQGESSNNSSLSIPVGNGTYAYQIQPPPGSAASPEFGNVTVRGANPTVNVTFGPAAPPTLYTVSFTEVGLIAGTAWGVEVGGTDTRGFGPTITVGLPNGSYSFQVQVPADFSSNPGIGFVTVAGLNESVSIPCFDVVQFEYRLTFSETGLGILNGWTVELDGVNVTSYATWIGFFELNGTYQFAIPSQLGFGSPTGIYEYNASPSSGQLQVAGHDVEVPVVFATAGPPPPPYLLTFVEEGLVTGANWSVDLNGSTASAAPGGSISFHVVNGSYTYIVAATANCSAGSGSTGALSVRGQPIETVVDFTCGVVTQPSPNHSIIFDETGLPPGTGWGVVIGSSIETGATSSITFANEPNGTYDFVVLAISGYVSTNSSGTVVLNGANTTILVQFSAITYPVIILEFGLPNGTNWSITVSDAATGFSETRYSTSNVLELNLPNGTYSITASLPPGFAYTLSSSTVTVAGRAPPNPSVEVTRQHPPGVGLTTIEEEALFAVAALAVVLTGGFLFWRRHKGGPGPAQGGTPSAPRHEGENLP